jgi:hypothetical protein
LKGDSPSAIDDINRRKALSDATFPQRRYSTIG